MITLTWFVVVCIVAALLLYISIVQYKRAEKALQFADTLMQNMETIQEYIKEATDKMENPRLKQAFEADDEVGFFFKELQNIQETLTSIIPDNNEETVTDLE